MFQLSTDADFNFEILRVLSMAPYEGADIGEVLVAAKEIEPGDFESFYNGFNNLALRAEKIARAIDPRRHPVSARNALFKLSNYYRSADFFLHGNWSDPRINALWEKQLSAFNDAMALMTVPGERITIHAKDGGFDIPAIFFGTGLPGRRPTLIACNGYDGSQEEMYHVIGQAALQRGMNFIAYEGPGQPTVRREQNLGFIPEWEKVVSPVIDYALERPEVDGDAIALMGFSFGGYLVPRAAAFDHRAAAIMAVDGIYDFGQSILKHLPDELQQIFSSGDAEKFNAILNKVIADPTTVTSFRWGVQQGSWALKTKTPFEFMTKAQAYNLTGLTDKITTPVFVGDAQLDGFFLGQGKELADHIGGMTTYHQFEAIDGAGEHCAIGATVYQDQVLLDWFEDIIHQPKNCIRP